MDFTVLSILLVTGQMAMSQTTQKIQSDDGVRLVFGKKMLKLESKMSTYIEIIAKPFIREDTNVSFTYDIASEVLDSEPEGFELIVPLRPITLLTGQTGTLVKVEARRVGVVILGFNSSSPQFQRISSSFMTVAILHSIVADTLAMVAGWVYCFMWSITFIPQIWQNWKTKSVVGLNFDFVMYSFIGFLAYALFNVVLTWSLPVVNQYRSLHPRGVDPVQDNDVVMALCLLAGNIVVFIQCCIYERGGQSFSRMCYLLIGLTMLYVAVCLALVFSNMITWLSFLYEISYIKIASVLIKYMPQVYMNIQRQSTIGWSVGYVICDITGSTLSLLQQLVIAYNGDDWGSILGNPVKFGLGLFSAMFDIIFLVQHYILYPETKETPLLEASYDKKEEKSTLLPPGVLSIGRSYV